MSLTSSSPELKPSKVRVPSNPESIFPKLHIIPFLAQLVLNHNCAQTLGPHAILSFVDTANRLPTGMISSPSVTFLPLGISISLIDKS